MTLLFQVILLSCLANSATAQSLILDDSQQYRFAGHLSYLEDPDGGLYLEDIQNPSAQFTSIEGQSLNKGFTSSVYWLKLSIIDKTSLFINNQWNMEISYPLLDNIDVYIVEQGKPPQYLVLGDAFEFNQRLVKHRNFIIPLSLSKNIETTVFLRVETSSSMQVPILLLNADTFYDVRTTEQYGLGLFYGMMLVMFFYNLFLWVSIRDSNYLWYIGYIGAFVLLQASTSGLGYQYIWPEFPLLQGIAPPLTIGMVGFFGTAFTRRFLRTRKYDKAADFLLLSVLVLSIILMLISFIFETSTVMVLGKVVVVTFLLFILYASVSMLLRGHRQARFFLAAWISLILGGLFTIGMMFGIFPNNFVMTHASKIGSVIEIVLLSFALADRINFIERKQKEIEQKAKLELERSHQKLQESLKLKDEFLATISHEFRTPLNGIQGSLELALNSDNKDVFPCLETARSSSDEMLNLVDQVLNYAELQAGELNIDLQEVVIEEFISSIKASISGRCKQKGITFNVRMDSDLPAVIAIDPRRLHQVMMPVLDNAVKFTDRGKVDLHVSIDSSDGQYWLCASVEDTGVGISEEKHKAILQAFTQQDGSSSRAYGGLGIGLSLVNELCLKLGGTLNISQNNKAGTSIDIVLPVDVKSSTDQKVAAIELSGSATAGRYNIMVVEDNHINQVVLKSMLERYDFCVYTCENGAKSLDLIEDLERQNKSVDLILMDCQMPVMDGFQATRQIRHSQFLASDVPIIAVTANTLSGDRERCLNSGMNDYLSKPFRLQELEATLKRWINF